MTSEKDSKLGSKKAFAYGFLTGIAFLKAVRFYQRWRLPSFNKVQSSVLPMLRANQDVRQVIGKNLKPGLLSGYAYMGGFRWSLPYFGKKANFSSLIPFTYEPWTLQVLFQVVGEKETGLVSVATLPGGKKDFGSDFGLKLVYVDFRDGQRLVLRGSVHQSSNFVEYEKLNKT